MNTPTSQNTADSTQAETNSSTTALKENRSRRGDLPRAHSTCPHDCPSTCALEVEIIDENTIGRVYGAKDNSYTQGVICAKVSRYAERIHHPDRLTKPLRRVGKKGVGIEAFEEITWDEALDTVATEFQRSIDTHGSESIWPYHYAGTMGLVQRDGIQRFRNMLGTSQQHSTFCTALADAGWRAGVGSKRGSDSRNMEKAELIVMWGGNPVNTQVNVMHHVSKARRLNNAKFIVIDPYLTGTAKKADQHLMLRPGTDGALACAVMQVLLSEDLADREYLAKYTDFSPAVEAHLMQKTPQWAADITGLSEAEIIEFARAFGGVKKSFLRCGYGFTRSRNGAVNMHAATCLTAITGAWQYEGGGALYSQGELYNIDSTSIQAHDHQKASARVLDQSRVGEVLCGNPIDLKGGPPITAMIIQNTNPLVVAPDSNRVKAGFERDDLFVCVHEQFMTDTAAMADIVIPATMFLEHDDLYQAGGHTHLQATRKLVNAPGDCKSNHEVLAALAKRLGCEHASDSLTEWELMDKTLAESNLPDAQKLYDQHWLDCAASFEGSNFLTGFATPDKRFHFCPDWSRVGKHVDGLPAMPDHMDAIEKTSDEHPFRLVAAPARQFLNTTFTEAPTSRKMERKPLLKCHPDDCAALGLEAGLQVIVGNQRGEIHLELESFEGLQRGVVVCESIWPNTDFGNGMGVNALISSEPGKPNGGAVFHDTAVWIRRP